MLCGCVLCVLALNECVVVLVVGSMPVDADSLRRKQQAKLNQNQKAKAAGAGADVVTPEVLARVNVVSRYLAGAPDGAADADLSRFSLPHVKAFLTVMMDPTQPPVDIDKATDSMIEVWGGSPEGFQVPTALPPLSVRA